MKLEHRKQAAQRAGDSSREQLADGLEKYADDIESEGRTYAPAFMREAAKRLRADQPAPTETGFEVCSGCGYVGAGHVLPSGLCPAAPQGAPQPDDCEHRDLAFACRMLLARLQRAFPWSFKGAPCSECLASPGAPHVSTCKAHERW